MRYLIAVTIVFLITGCAGTQQDQPVESAQTADKIGPGLVVNGNAIFNYGSIDGLQKLADSFDADASDATGDVSQQGSTEQRNDQSGATAGPIQQDPSTSVDVTTPDMPGL